MERPVALVVDREASVRALVGGVLEERGLVALGAQSPEDARNTLADRSIALMLIDLAAQGTTASRALIEHVSKLRPQPLIVGLGQASIDLAGSQASRSALFDVLPKPLDRGRIERLAQRALSQLELLDKLRDLQANLQRREGYQGIVGRSEAMERFRTEIERLAWNNEPLWIVGEDGAGKELAARTLHAESSRAEREFVLVNCGEIPHDAVGLGGGDSGLVRAEGGTLYLEELSALPVETQEELARSLKQGALSRGTRVVIGSRDEPQPAFEDGHLASGLYATLSGAVLHVPALRQRTEDIPLLADHFISVICEINRLPPMRISPEALSLMKHYAWPGNVQELRNAVEQAVILSSGGTIRTDDLPERIRESRETAWNSAPSPGLSRRPFRSVKREIVEAFERAYLSELLDRHGGNVTAASQQAGMLRSALQRLLRKYSLKSADFRKSRRLMPQRAPSESIDESS